MARKTGLGPQGRRTIDEARASDTASKGAFSEIPGRVESGQTEAPTDTIPGYVTAAERPKRKRKGGIGGIGRTMIDDARANPPQSGMGIVMNAADRLAGMLPAEKVGSPATPDRQAARDKEHMDYMNQWSAENGTPHPQINDPSYSGLDNAPRSGEQWRGGPATPERQAARDKERMEYERSRNSPSNTSMGPLISGTVSGNTPSAANAGPGRSGPTNTSYGGGGGGGPVISNTSTPGNGGGSTPGSANIQSGIPWLDLGLKAAKMMVTPSPYAPMTWMERNLSPEGMSMLYGRGAGIQPLNGYQTSRFHIQPKKKDPSDNFHSARHDPNIAEQAPLEQRRLDGSFQGDVELPAFRQGGQTTASERLHRDPLHENATQNLWGTPHEAAMGNLSGDVHTRTTRGFGDSSPSGRVESIRAPKPE